MDCACHGEPCQWHKDPRYRAGGFWVCAVRRRERQMALYHDPRNAEAVLRKRMREYTRKHRQRLTQLQEVFVAEVPFEE